MFREVGKTKKKPFSAEFPARNKQSLRGSGGNHNRIPLRQHFRTQQQQRWQRNTTSHTTNESNVKTQKTSRNYLLQHFCRTSSTRKIRTHSSFSKRNVPGGIKTKCSSRRKNFSFRAILGKAHKRSGNFRNNEGIQNSLSKGTVVYQTDPNRIYKLSQTSKHNFYLYHFCNIAISEYLTIFYPCFIYCSINI